MSKFNQTHSHEYIEVPKGGGLRWAVGSAQGLRGSTWRLWGNKNGDIYLAMRNLGHELKLSVHKDRRCHFGYTSESGNLSQGTESRHFEKWILPEGNAVRAVRIFTPSTELEHFISDEKNPMKWLESPKEGMMNVVALVICEPADTIQLESIANDGTLLGTITSKTRTAWLFQSNNVIDDHALTIIEKGHQIDVSAEHADRIENEEHMRMVIWAKNELQNELYFYELSVRK